MFKNKKITQSHHYGLDLLRIIAMFMIVITHVLGKGGLRSTVEGHTDPYFITTWLIQVMVYGAVNCYALMSGYVGVHSTFKYSKLLGIWLQVFFYSFMVTLLFALFGFPISMDNWRQAFFPIVSGNYWYITAYFGLLIFMPIINGGLNALTTSQLKQLSLLIFTVFSVMPAVMNNRVPEFSLSKGFEMTWLIILYIIGAYLKRIDLTIFKDKILIAVYLLSVAVTYLMKFVVGDIWYWYISPSLTIGAIALFMLFAKMTISPTTHLASFIKLVAPATLGVYLGHLHPLLVKFVIRDFAEPLVNSPIILYPFLIILVSIMIYGLAFLVEKARIAFFKQLGIPRWLGWVDRHLPFV
ncbi:acyltransferase [Streptococcus phocae subsp. salmonis]|uniref:acyltransferase n=1 Tax=Streptococcus phocae TaxID=119224 RepID=UPI0005319EBF|nr:acyltransferase family protein [Streptococcus phocae]KGR72849.1 membrane protein [Streptococcus phocae subsp. salmonis]